LSGFVNTERGEPAVDAAGRYDPAPVNVADLLLAPARGTPESTALADAAGALTYGELAASSQGYAAWLTESGVRPGDRVAIPGTNDAGFVSAWIGALLAGAVAVPLNPMSPPAELDRELDTVAPVHRPGAPPGTLSTGSAAPVARAEEDVAALLFTAGTGGPPRAAMLTHGNLAANVRQVLGHPAFAVRPDDLCLGALPVFHVFGLNVALDVALAAGASVALTPDLDAATTARLVRERGITVVAGVPAMWGAWLALAAADAPGDSFASVRLAVSGAAALPEAVAAGFERRFGVPIREGYGLTEAAGVVTALAPEGPPAPAGSIGSPLPGVEVRLVDGDGTDVLAGDPGEVWVRGANVFAGYWGAPEATSRALSGDGWLRTGDVAVSDDHGRLRLVDRAKDLIIVSGFNVYPAEVEDVLHSHPSVAEAAVVGEEHPRTGEAVVAFVVPVREHRPAATGAALGAYCADVLARYKCPTRVEVVDELPRSFAGKVLRRALRPPPGPSA
jgi:long-chain acyl-CoA synthetase